MEQRVLVFTVDGTAAQTVVPLLERRELAVTVAHDLGSALPRFGDHQVVILDAADTSRVTLLCRQINDVAGSRHPPILAVAHSSDVEERVRLLEAGADDVLGHPIDERELEALVDALLSRAPTPTASGSAPDTGVVRTTPASPGRVIAFAAAKGGSGTTSLAVNTALILAEMAPGSVAIADLDLYHGQVSTHLDIYARNSTAQMAREDRATQTPELIHEAGKQHASGLVVFGGPYRPDEGLDVRGDQLASLVEALRSTYGTVVLDLGSMVDARTLQILAQADHLVMPITPDIPSLRLLHAALQVLSETGPVTDRAIFVVNDIYPKHTITAEQIEEHLGIKISVEVPYDGENFMRAVNEGQPLMSLARRSAAAGAIRRLAELTAETRLDDEVEPPQRRGLLGGLLRRG